ncbi:MAG: S9 family peptidase [Bacteroidia bacterium]|nr:S9 family peptidase [Bacteroidia bacterium]
MKYISFILLATGFTNMLNAQITYPQTKKVSQKDNYFGTEISDPYRWLENDTASDTKAWVKAENKVTFDYLSKITYRDKIKNQLLELNNYPKFSSPIKVGEYYFFYKNNGLQNQSVIWYQKGINGTPEIFLDPNAYSNEGTVAISLAGFSKDKKHVVISISRAGSDWQEFKVMQVADKKELSDKLEWVKFSGAAWQGNGFYYSRYDSPVKGKEFSNQNKNHKIYYHTLGTLQSKDKLIYTDPKNPLRYFGASLTKDERFLFINISEGTYGTEILYKDLSLKQKDFKVLFKGFENDYGVIDNDKGMLLAITDRGAPNKKVIMVNPLKPEEANWETIVPEKEELLEGVGTGGNRMFLSYLKDATTRVFQYTYDGLQERDIILPGKGTASGFGGEKADEELFYTYTSFNYPPTIFSYNIGSGKSELFRKPELKFNPEDFESKQVFFTSKDSTKVPMFIVYKKGIVLDGKNPTLLYGYGGFNISLTPSFSPSRIAFMNNGGVYVMVNLRGGGEYGEDWHKAGMLNKKQNVFDDFIGAAEYLIKENYTSKDFLAIQGGSNGGLLVGACMTQRPYLFKVAFPAVGVLDMLRFHKFTVGWGWVVEYGSSDKKEDFDNLMTYSPLHNIKAVSYPATMVTTADHDDRVVPAHSFKFIAELQDKHTGTNPVLIRIETNAGHGAGKPISKAIDEIADIYAFMFYNMGLEWR